LFNGAAGCPGTKARYVRAAYRRFPAVIRGRFWQRGMAIGRLGLHGPRGRLAVTAIVTQRAPGTDGRGSGDSADRARPAGGSHGDQSPLDDWQAWKSRQA
jgi:hypothetical protein